MANRFMKILTSGRTYSMGIAVGIATWLLAWIVSFFNIVNVLNIGGQTVSTGALSLNVGTTAQSLGTANSLGVKAMALLTSIPMVGTFVDSIFNATNFMALFIVVVGSIILVIIGRSLYTFKPLQIFRKQKLAVELFYGAVVGTILIGLPGLGGVGVQAIVTMAIYYVIVAFVVTQLARTKWYGKLVKE